MIIVFAGCSDDQQTSPSGCLGCHQVQLDQNHQMPCISCHLGNSDAKTIEIAHQGFIARPAHPDNAEKACGSCHVAEIKMVKSNNHYTLAAHISNIKQISESSSDGVDLNDIKPSAIPRSDQELLNDLLRRKCLRCHVYSSGDEFPLTSRATGCGACHLEFYNGKMTSHQFRKMPGDGMCLSCHYGNHVGFDYYGRFEHDFNEEYRTPYTTSNDFFRPYGVEFHQLEADIHQQAGMVCIDCHDREQVMGLNNKQKNCSSCHDNLILAKNQNDAISHSKNHYIFTSTATGKTFTLPIIKHPVHDKYKGKIGCQVCHAQWSFNDTKTHLLRIDHEEFEPFERLTLDGDANVNRILTSNIDFEADPLSPNSSDYFTGEQYPGIWLKGYTERRWEHPRFSIDNNGLMNVSRSILDIHLSWIDSDEIVRFDNISPFTGNRTDLPYVPHTTGHAGPFYRERLKQFFMPPDNQDPLFSE